MGTPVSVGGGLFIETRQLHTIDNMNHIRHISGMSAPQKSQKQLHLRDDNLRLIFSETELKILNEKRADAIAGFYAIAAVISLTALIAMFFFLTPYSTSLDGTDYEIIIVGLGLLGFFGCLITVVSPIIAIGLLIELRQAAKAKASLIDLLMRYKRPIPENK